MFVNQKLMAAGSAPIGTAETREYFAGGAGMLGSHASTTYFWFLLGSGMVSKQFAACVFK